MPLAERVMKKESGFSLLSVLITMGVVLGLIVLSLQKTILNKKASKAAESSASYESFIPNFTEFIQESIHNNLSNLCGGTSGNLPNLTFNGTSAGFTSNLNIPRGVQQAEQLAKRCQSPQFSPSGRFYFCLQLASNPEYPKDSFAGAAFNFSELNIQMVNKWQQPINCAAYNAAESGSVGLQVYYTFYWLTKSRPDYVYLKKGFYYAIKK